MLLVLIAYIVSAVSWGLILFQLTKVIISSIRVKFERPPLLVPLAVASLAIFIESVYFGISAYFYLTGKQNIFMFMHQGQNWFLITLLVAISGVLLLFNLNINPKGEGKK